MSAEQHLATRGRRLGATVIDLCLVPIAGALLMLVTGAMESAEAYAGPNAIIRPLLLAFSGYFLLNGYPLWRRGQTVGKLLVGIRLAMPTDGAIPPPWRWVLRSLFFMLWYGLILPPIGVLVVIEHLFIFRKDHRCLHDLICGTVVVRIGGS